MDTSEEIWESVECPVVEMVENCAKGLWTPVGRFQFQSNIEWCQKEHQRRAEVEGLEWWAWVVEIVEY